MISEELKTIIIATLTHDILRYAIGAGGVYLLINVALARLLLEADRPAEAWEAVEALVDHFQALIRVPGSSYGELVKNAYRKKSSYQLALNRLSRSENEFNRALAPHLQGDPESISQVVEAMARSVKKNRRALGDEIFS